MDTSKDPETTPKKAPERKALGRGLAALLGDSMDDEALSEGNPPSTSLVERSFNEKELADSPFQVLRISEVEPNPDQPRQNFNESRLQELADSIQEQGLIQPILVRRVSDHNYQIIAGERRWRASKLAGLEEIKAIIREESATAESNDLASLIENIQREELSPIELARAYGRVLSEYSMTQEQLSKKLGMGRVSLANTIRLLKLPEKVKDLINLGRISEGHGRALLALDDDKKIEELAAEVVEKGYTVRDTEARARAISMPNSASMSASTSASGDASDEQNPDSKSYKKSAHLLALEDELRELFGTKVQIRGTERRGTIELFFSGQDSFNRILHELRGAKK